MLLCLTAREAPLTATLRYPMKSNLQLWTPLSVGALCPYATMCHTHSPTKQALCLPGQYHQDLKLAWGEEQGLAHPQVSECSSEAAGGARHRLCECQRSWAQYLNPTRAGRIFAPSQQSHLRVSVRSVAWIGDILYSQYALLWTSSDK